jgi:hypothetical protein
MANLKTATNETIIIYSHNLLYLGHKFDFWRFVRIFPRDLESKLKYAAFESCVCKKMPVRESNPANVSYRNR